MNRHQLPYNFKKIKKTPSVTKFCSLNGQKRAGNLVHRKYPMFIHLWCLQLKYGQQLNVERVKRVANVLCIHGAFS